MVFAHMAFDDGEVAPFGRPGMTCNLSAEHTLIGLGRTAIRRFGALYDLAVTSRHTPDRQFELRSSAIPGGVVEA